MCVYVCWQSLKSKGQPLIKQTWGKKAQAESYLSIYWKFQHLQNAWTNDSYSSKMNQHFMSRLEAGGLACDFKFILKETEKILKWENLVPSVCPCL